MLLNFAAEDLSAHYNYVYHHFIFIQLQYKSHHRVVDFQATVQNILINYLSMVLHTVHICCAQNGRS